MESIINTFHVDIRLLLAQTFNFAVAFSVLYFFALKPLFNVLKERSDKIAKSLEQGKEIEERLEQTNKEYQEQIAQARKEAVEIIEKANKLNVERSQDMMEKAKVDVSDFIKQEKEKIESERVQVAKEIKGEIADLIKLSVNKIIQNRPDIQNDRGTIRYLSNKK
ncbi:MAG: F0F1 ATP synthase subunit B [Candidatus Paceibacterota bacterium]